MESLIKPKGCSVLLKEFEGRQPEARGKRLKFTSVGDRDVYNITAPFDVDGEKVIAARVEKRDSEFSNIMFSPTGVKCGNLWTALRYLTFRILS